MLINSQSPSWHSPLVDSSAHVRKAVSLPARQKYWLNANFEQLISIIAKPKPIRLPKLMVFGDGRVSYLNTYIANMNNTEMSIEVEDQPGSGIRACTSAAYMHIYEHPSDICLIMGVAQDLLGFDNYI